MGCRVLAVTLLAKQNSPAAAAAAPAAASAVGKTYNHTPAKKTNCNNRKEKNDKINYLLPSRRSNEGGGKKSPIQHFISNINGSSWGRLTR